MDAARRVSAVFIPVYTLTVDATSGGSITSGDGRITCPTGGGASCAADYTSGTVTLTATASAGHVSFR